MNIMLPCRRWLPLWLLVALVFAGGARADEVIPPKPTRYFNDYAHAVRPATASRLNGELENLEKQTSNQILVCIYPKMQTDSSIEDYCHRIYAGWGVGQKGKNNGAVLFVFTQDHKERIETGRGLEGPLPDSVCKDILEDTMAPQFRAGDFDGGLTSGVAAMIRATGGEFKGTGRTADEVQHGDSAGYDNTRNSGGLGGGAIVLLIIGVIVFIGLGIMFPGFFSVVGFIFNILSMFSGGRGTTFGGSSGGGGGWSSGGGDSGAGGGASGSW